MLCAGLSGPSYHSLPWVCRGGAIFYPYSYDDDDDEDDDDDDDDDDDGDGDDEDNDNADGCVRSSSRNLLYLSII